ncbi:MAG: hypothetical protein PF439_11640 [Helicobacteraceae bacterium]|jgi:ADP-heptose:LPS heptosyltransferase|nr:hypothetical protein [Helicobacteraceae bacterium]
MNIAIFMQNRPHFGANLLHIPLIYSLKQCFPDADITLFSKNGTAKILTSVMPIKNIHVTKDKFKEVQTYQKLDADITISLRKNSLPVTLAMILLNRNKTYGYANFLSRLFFTKTLPFNQSLFRTESYLALLPDQCPKQYLPSIPVQQKHICLMPGGAFDWKHWDIENYLKLADRLKNRLPEYTVYFVMGEMEEPYVKTIEAWHNHYEILINQPLKALFELVQSSQLVIANDCGPSHIAQISDVKNIILYSSEVNDGNSVAKEWFRDKEDSAFIVGVKGESINTIDVDSVYQSALRSLHLG